MDASVRLDKRRFPSRAESLLHNRPVTPTLIWRVRLHHTIFQVALGLAVPASDTFLDALAAVGVVAGESSCSCHSRNINVGSCSHPGTYEH